MPKLERYECPQCGEILFDRDALQRLQGFRAAQSKRTSAVEFDAGEINKLLHQGERSIEREGTLDADETLAARRARRQTRKRK